MMKLVMEQQVLLYFVENYCKYYYLVLYYLYCLCYLEEFGVIVIYCYQHIICLIIMFYLF